MKEKNDSGTDTDTKSISRDGSIRSQSSTPRGSHHSDQKEDKSQKKLGKYGFRLSPEEQEIAYELKASLMRKLEEQNSKINTELQLHRTFQHMKRADRAKSSNPYSSSEMSRANAIKLMKLYEKNSTRAEARIKELEKDLEISQDLARRYHSMYMRERERNSTDKNNSSQEAAATPRDVETKQDTAVTEDDLEDDKAIYKRHVARLADTKSMKNLAPIRVEDVIRKSETVHMENESLKAEVQRLKWDNAQLIKHAKHSREERDKLMHNVGTSEHARQELQHRLEREKTQHQKLQRSLTRQTSDWIQLRKEAHEAEESRRWANVGAIAPYDSEGRAKHPTKKNVDKPRKMHPVEEYDKSEAKT